MTQRETMKQIRDLGLTVSSKNDEWRVNYKNGTEDTAYYCEDKKDALDTAKFMVSEIKWNNEW